MQKIPVNKTNKGVALLVIFATIVVVVILANVALRLILNQFRLTHHQVGRIRAYYAGLAGMNLAFEKIRLGDWSPAAAGGAIRYGCINNCIDAGATYPLVLDADIPFNVQIAISPQLSGINNTAMIRVKTNYTYQN
jgi:Tfp pilus assembly protein PilX